MKKYAFNEITFMQFVALNTGFIFSNAYVLGPPALFKKVVTNSWLSLLIGWAISVIASLILVQVMKKFPDGTLLDLLKRYGGKWAGRLGAVLLALYTCYSASVLLIYSIMITKEWLLPKTPAFIIEILFFIPTYMIARNGIRIIGRYYELILFISLWIPIVYTLPLKDAHWLHLLPQFKEGWMPVLSAIPDTFTMYYGFGVSTFIFYPFLQKKEKASLALFISLTICLVMYLYISMVCLVNFSPDEIKEFTQPTISVLKVIEFTFIERFEVLFIAFYLPVFTLAWISQYYVTSFSTSWLAGNQDHRNHMRILFLLVAIGIYLFIPAQAEQFTSTLPWIAFGVEYVFPSCLLIFIWIYVHVKKRRIV